MGGTSHSQTQALNDVMMFPSPTHGQVLSVLQLSWHSGLLSYRNARQINNFRMYIFFPAESAPSLTTPSVHCYVSTGCRGPREISPSQNHSFSILYSVPLLVGVTVRVKCRWTMNFLHNGTTKEKKIMDREAVEFDVGLARRLQCIASHHQHRHIFCQQCCIVSTLW